MSVMNLPYGSDQAVKLISMGLFATNSQRNTTLNRLTGPMPTQADAENTMRVQSSTNYPIVVCKDLQKGPGDEVTFDLINDINGKPIMGDANAQGLGEAPSFAQDKLRINQTRKPIDTGGVMTQQRTRWQMRSLCKALGQKYMDALVDQLCLVHMAGSRGFHDNIEWKVPLASDSDFATICVNAIRAPTYNRHYMSTGSGVEHITAAANEISLASTDVMNTDVVDSIRTLIDSIALPPAPVIFDGDVMATDSPLRVLLLSSEQYTAFVQSPTTNFRQLQSQAYARGNMGQGKPNPLFLGDAGLWNGILLVKMPKPIRFYAGNALNYCASATSATETATDLVPAAFGTTYAVDRAILLGGQALATALGKNPLTGNPFFWSEEEMDHKNRLEVLIGMINGMSKIRFLIDFGAGGKQYTDNGIIAIDTAVRLAGV
jgi:N4-gp56 family major capsid protein